MVFVYGKKMGLFSILKTICLSDAHSKSVKEKRRRWVFGRLKFKKSASLSAPSPPREKTLSVAEEEQRKQAATVALATAAAADAAVAAARAAAEIVWLTGTPKYCHEREEETKEFPVIKLKGNAPLLAHQYEQEIQDLAATKIQTTYRGYLARKALRALKGLVKIQAIIRGRAVRRQAISTLRCLQSIVNIQSQVCARRFQKVEGTMNFHEKKELKDFRDKDIKIDANSQRRWDDSILTKEEENAMFLSKREAVIKRERVKEYLFNHRRSTESEQGKVNERWREWLEQWVDNQFTKEDIQNPGSVFNLNARTKEEFGGRQLKLRNIQKLHMAGIDSPKPIPRRSFHRKQCSFGDDNSNTGSPSIPTYMAATESAKAKARSMSSPKLRPINIDAYSEINSPYKHKLSPISSINSEMTSSSRIGRPHRGLAQRSPCLKGHQSPVKSNRSSKDLSLDSDCSRPNSERPSVSRSARDNNLCNI